MLTLPMAALVLSNFDAAGLRTEFADAFSGFAHVAAPVAVTALWQDAVVAAGLALCLRLAPRVAAAHRFAAWAAGYSVLMALPFVPALSHLVRSNAGSNIGIGAASLSSPTAHSWLGHSWPARPWLEISDRWSLAIAALWVLVALARAIDLGIHTARLRRLWKSAALRALHSLDEYSGIGSSARQRTFEICTTRELDRPSVIGFFAPRILIPEWLLERLTRQELEQVVLHEAEHLRRRDDWTNLVQKLCLVVFPLNPALAFIERNLCREREMACDEGVVRRTQAPRAYAACLTGLAERHMERRAEALSLGAFERRPELARRVHSILERRSAMSPLAGRALVGAVGCALAVGAVALARCPQVVAFVPAEPEVTAETTQADAAQMVAEELRGDKLVALADSHFRAVNAMAIVPGTTGRMPTDYRATALKAGRHTGEPKNGQARYGQTAVSAPTMAAGTDAVADTAKFETALPQELIVLTAFEQVQATGDVSGDRVVSDFGATNARPTDGNVGQITITRLVFRIYPAGPVGKRLPAADSLISQPHAVALGNGWFVIQL
jgi:beta-lactamase regulating signal transducer with metallopeptidase domain